MCAASLVSLCLCVLLVVASHAGVSQAAGCYDGESAVRTERSGAGTVPMRLLAIGDRVLVYDESTQRTAYSAVTHWLHREPATNARFVELSTDAGGAPLTITAEHIVYSAANCSTGAQAIRKGRAGAVRPGDCMLAAGDGHAHVRLAEVTHVRRVDGTGIYAPMTNAGTIVVQGVATSCAVGERDETIFKWANAINDWVAYVGIGAHGGEETVPMSTVHQALVRLRRWVSLGAKPTGRMDATLF